MIPNKTKTHKHMYEVFYVMTLCSGRNDARFYNFHRSPQPFVVLKLTEVKNTNCTILESDNNAIGLRAVVLDPSFKLIYKIFVN